VVFPERVPAETKVDQTVSVVDLPATVLELTGVDDSPLPGHSLSRHWKGGAATSTEPVVAELVGPSAFPPNHGASPIFGGPMRAVFDGGFKYIRAGDVEELFDLDRDPREERNLVGEAGHGETLERLRELAGSPGR
jgi:arylsulfatase A-like enzyme